MDTHQIEGTEVIEREVKKTGNGAHVYVPKEWLDDTVKIVRAPREEEFEVCDFCVWKTKDTEEWTWTDSSGGSLIRICYRCRSELEESPDGVCAVCREEYEPGKAKSAGFGSTPVTEDEWYGACDGCRKWVVFDRAPSPKPAWLD